MFLLERFKEIFQHTLKWEGGEKLHNVAGDAGGWTKYGIAYNYNKKHFKDLEDFKAMKYDKACEIAFENYCKPLPLELIPEDCQALVFDIAFNSGVKKSIQLIQRALNLIDDGVCGPKTRAALKNLDKGELADERNKFYNAIIASNPTQKKFLKGWLNRSDYFRNTEI